MANQPIVSKMSVYGHPIHPVLIHFPVAALLGLVGTDLTYIYSADDFWARAGLWLAGVGALGGWIAGLVGLIDLIWVRRIRRLVTAWCHGVLAIMLLSLATFNWQLRLLAGAESQIQPQGLYLSLLTGLLIAVTGYLGGRLVYEYAVGVDTEETPP